MQLHLENGKYVFKTNAYAYLKDFSVERVSTKDLGFAFEPEQQFEDPDGSEIIFDSDYLCNIREVKTIPGPFAVGNNTTMLPFAIDQYEPMI